MSEESTPETQPAIMQVPYYVDPAVLKPGQTVYAMLGDTQTALLVLHVEPTLVCRTPDGTVVYVQAHLASLQP